MSYLGFSCFGQALGMKCEYDTSFWAVEGFGEDGHGLKTESRVWGHYSEYDRELVWMFVEFMGM